MFLACIVYYWLNKIEKKSNNSKILVEAGYDDAVLDPVFEDLSGVVHWGEFDFNAPLVLCYRRYWSPLDKAFTNVRFLHGEALHH